MERIEGANNVEAGGFGNGLRGLGGEKPTLLRMGRERAAGWVSGSQPRADPPQRSFTVWCWRRNSSAASGMMVPLEMKAGLSPASTELWAPVSGRAKL